MSQMDLAFFVVGLVVFFAFALAVQMRIFAGIALKRAAKDRFSELDDGTARFAVVNAVNGRTDLDEGDAAGDAATWLRLEYPKALRHVRLARRGSMAMGALLLAVIIAWRVSTGAAG